MPLPRSAVASGFALAVLMVVAGCADTDDGGATATEAPQVPLATTTSTITPSTALAPPPTTAPPTTVAPVAEPDCRPLDDPMEGTPTGWVVVNDGVMGGRSDGQASLVEDVLVFEGEIVTDGGGFSSIRTNVPEGALDGVDRIVVRARADDRGYLLTARDAAAGRGRRVSFQAAIPFESTPDGQAAEVRLEDLDSVVFGQPVDDAAFAPELAIEIGVQLSDGFDGPFRLELDALLACTD